MHDINDDLDNIFAGSPGTPIDTSFCVTTLDGVYVEVDEYTAETGGFDSPGHMVGKTDADCPWQGNDGNERRRLIDAICRTHGTHTSTNWCRTTSGWNRYSMTETLKREGDKEYFHFNSIDTTALCNHHHWLDRIKFDEGYIDLGPAFGDARLSADDCQVARYRLLGYSHSEILKLLPHLTPRLIKQSAEYWHRCRRDAEAQRRELEPQRAFHRSVMVSSGLTPLLLENADWFMGREI